MNRTCNVVFSLFFLVVTFPLLLVLALLIKLESSGPLFFKQKRVGKKQRPFYIYKFRSMYLHESSPEQLGPIKHGHSLVTRVGYFIRRFKLDEVPQFINVLSGQMSLIGPRPCLFSKIDAMTEVEKRRFSVLPGVTGWAEVNGNVELDWNEQLMLDLWYVDNKTFRLDIYIFFKTILIILFGSKKNSKALVAAENYLRSSKPPLIGERH